MVNLLSSFEDDDYVYLVFEACMRGDLYQLLVKQKGAMTERFVATQVKILRPSTSHDAASV